MSHAGAESQGSLIDHCGCRPRRVRMLSMKPASAQIEAGGRGGNQMGGFSPRRAGHPCNSFYGPFRSAILIAYYLMADVMWITPLRAG